MKKLMILGASGHGKVVADIAEKNGYNEIAFLDDDPALKTCGKYPVLGPSGNAAKWEDADFFVAIGNSRTRERFVKELKEKGKTVISLIHPQAVIAEDVAVGIGTAVMAGAVVNPGTTVGQGCIINTGATVDHDCCVGDYVHISVGSHLAGTVRVGDHTWIGIGAVVSNNLTICADCVIGAGAAVVDCVNAPGTYVGVPAKVIK